MIGLASLLFAPLWWVGLALVLYGSVRLLMGYFLMNASPNNGPVSLSDVLLTAMALVANEDGRLDRKEVADLQAMLQHLTGRSHTEAQIRVFCAGVTETNGMAFLEASRSYLDERERSYLLRAMLLVASADGQFDEREKHRVREVAQAVGMSEAEILAVTSPE